jgi:hypothetical protein
MANQQQSCSDVAPRSGKNLGVTACCSYEEPEPLKRSVRGLITLRNGARIIEKIRPADD